MFDTEARTSGYGLSSSSIASKSNSILVLIVRTSAIAEEGTHLMDPAPESKLGKLVTEDGGLLFWGSSACSSSILSFGLGRETCTSLELMAELTAERLSVCVVPVLVAVVGVELECTMCRKR